MVSELGMVRPWMLVLVGLVVMAGAARGEGVVERFAWEGADPATREAVRLSPGVPRAAGEVLVAGKAGEMTTRRILVVESPGVKVDRYAVTGEVKYEGVAAGAGGAVGYLEMWSYFADGSAYFSRTLAESGPLGALRGSSDWRGFVLPFQNKAGGPPPVRLVVNVVLPGAGKVWVRQGEVVEYGAGRAGSVWWQVAGPVAAGVGLSLGLVVVLAARGGRGRRWIMGLGLVYAAAAVAMMVVGTVELVWPGSVSGRAGGEGVEGGSLLGMGSGMLVLLVVLGVVLRRMYARGELRRMMAMDAR